MTIWEAGGRTENKISYPELRIFVFVSPYVFTENINFKQYWILLNMLGFWSWTFKYQQIQIIKW